MALFKKNKKEESSYPSGLPELPKLPELPPAGPKPNQGMMPKPNALPRFPSSPTGNRFSQNTIKDAVSGEKRGDVVDEFEKEIQKMPRFPDKSMAKAPRAPMMEEHEEEDEEDMPPRPSQNPEMIITPRTSRVSSVSQREEPVFIRLDKFEESLDTFEKIKKQLSGAEKLLNEIKDVKEREDKELADWQSKLEAMKNQIEKIDRDIFSKV